MVSSLGFQENLRQRDNKNRRLIFRKILQQNDNNDTEIVRHIDRDNSTKLGAPQQPLKFKKDSLKFSFCKLDVITDPNDRTFSCLIAKNRVGRKWLSGTKAHVV